MKQIYSVLNPSHHYILYKKKKIRVTCNLLISYVSHQLVIESNTGWFSCVWNTLDEIMWLTKVVQKSHITNISWTIYYKLVRAIKKLLIYLKCRKWRELIKSRAYKQSTKVQSDWRERERGREGEREDEIEDEIERNKEGKKI